MAGGNLANAILSSIGENHKQQKVKSWLDTGFAPLNFAISNNYNGGMPCGRIVEMFGPESSGKTAIATKVMVAAQQMGGVAWFNDHERSFDVDLGVRLGLDTEENGHWIFRTPDTFERSVTTTIKGAQALREAGLDMDAPIVVVFDSLASMVPQSKFAKDVDEQGMNDSLALAKACSAVFPTLAIYAEKLNMMLLVLNQEREKPGVAYGNPITTPGGKALKFYASVRIHLSRKQLVDGQGASKENVGQEITAKVIKNKVSRPFLEASWNFMFHPEGFGYFDVTTSMLNYLTSKGLLKTSGARIIWTDGKSYFKKALAEKIEAEGLQSELTALLP